MPIGDWSRFYGYTWQLSRRSWLPFQSFLVEKKTPGIVLCQAFVRHGADSRKGYLASEKGSKLSCTFVELYGDIHKFFCQLVVDARYMALAHKLVEVAV